MLADLRFALRSLRQSPGFTAVAVLTLALGIGANTAIFSVVNAALIQPLPYPDAGQLVDVMETLPDGRPNGGISGGAFKDWREHATTFARLAAYEDTRRNLTGAGRGGRHFAAGEGGHVRLSSQESGVSCQKSVVSGQ